MNFGIRVSHDDDMEAIVRLSLLAWEPVFESFRTLLGPAVYPVIWPDWRIAQRETVERFCAARENRVVLVAELADQVVGFLVYELNHKDKTGEVQLLAVHPDYQNQGIGTALNTAALTQMKESGMKVSTVATGGDPAHAPARRSYEKAGYRAFPQVWYFTDL